MGSKQAQIDYNKDEDANIAALSHAQQRGEKILLRWKKTLGKCMVRNTITHA